MENKDVQGPIIIITLVVAILFFGGWFWFYGINGGVAPTSPTTPPPSEVTPTEKNPEIIQNNIEATTSPEVTPAE